MKVSQAHKTALDKAVLGLFRVKNAGFFTALYCGMDVGWSIDGNPTAYVQGKKMRINPDWFLSLTERSRVSLISHEIRHVAYLHPQRLNGRNHRRWNEAADHAINLQMLEEGYHFDMPGLMDPRFTGMSAEQIYAVLDKEAKEPELPFGEDFKPSTKEEREVEEFEVTELLIKASTVAKMTSGGVPGDIEEIITGLLAPILPWHVLLARWLNAHSEIESTWSRPNRRYEDIYLPSRASSNGLDHLVWAVDTSGSMTSEMLQRINSEMVGAYSKYVPERMTVITFDAAIQNQWEFTPNNPLRLLTVKGRGWTDMTEVFEFVAKTRPNALIMLSDMGCEIPEEIPGIPVLWVCLDNPEWEPPYGTVVHVDTHTP